VEGLLLLAENLPRDPTRKINGKNEEPEEIHALGSGEEVHSNENRQAWMLIGTAIRCAYGLGLDKVYSILLRSTGIADIENSWRLSCFTRKSGRWSLNGRGWLGHVRAYT